MKIKYTSAISSIKTLLHWDSSSIELELVDIEPRLLSFKKYSQEPLGAKAPKLTLSIKVGQKWRHWEEIPCSWSELNLGDLVGLVPLWNEVQHKEFKKYLELTLSI